MSFVVGSIGTHIVHFLQGQSFHDIPVHHPLITSIKFVMISLPIWYLYKRYGEKHLGPALQSSAFEIIFLASAKKRKKTS